MGKLIYSIADLSIGMELPFDLDISKESARFIRLDSDNCEEQIKVIPVDVLPAMPDFGIWHQDRYYVGTDVGELFYIRPAPGKAPYAMIEYYNAHPVRITYHRDSKDMIPQSRYLLNMLGLEALLLRHDGLILHSSFVCWNGRGILFSAPSGTGKSTQASLWEKHMGAQILNGDRAGIRCVNGVWRAYGLPYAGSSHIFHNESAPIHAIVILRQSSENVLRKMKAPEALRALLPEFSAHRWNAAFMNKVFDIAAAAVRDVPVYWLECRPDQEAVRLLYNTLIQETIK